MSVNQDVQELVFRYDSTALQKADADLKKTTGQIHKLETAADQVSGVRGGRSGMAGFAQSMMQAGRSIQDFQAAGLMGITNNIEGLAMSLGLGAGVAGVATIAAVAIQALTPQIKNLFGAEEVFGTRMEELKKKIEELDGKKIKLEADTSALDDMKRELTELQKAASDFQAIISQQSKFEQASGKRIGEAIVETPGGQEAVEQTRQALVDQAIAPFQQIAADAKQKLDALAEKDRGVGLTAGDIDAQRELRRQLKAAEAGQAQAGSGARDAFNVMLERSRSGSGQEQVDALASLRRTLAALGGSGGQGLAGMMGGMTPAAMAAEEQRQAAMAEFEKARTERQKASAAAEKKRQQAEEEEADRWVKEMERPFRERAEAVDARNRRQGAQRQAAQEATQTQLADLAAQGEQRNIMFDYARLQQENRELVAQVQRLIAMGANQIQIQAALGDEMAAIQNRTLDLEQRQRSLALREQQRRNTFQMRNPGP